MKKNSKFIISGMILVGLVVGSVFVARNLKGPVDVLKVVSPKNKGPVDAPIQMEVYSDFQCPACKNAIEPIEDLRAEFSDDVKVVFRHFPLEQNHRWALMAAHFSECAGDQGKFWEFHNEVYEHQEEWSSDSNAATFFIAYAKKMGLDMEVLETCLSDQLKIKNIRAERETGVKRGVRSTPTIFINDEIVVGGVQLEEQGAGIIREKLKEKEL
jgi:protein-disulfide isomerase